MMNGNNPAVPRAFKVVCVEGEAIAFAAGLE
jgi:hypothetical protein